MLRAWWGTPRPPQGAECRGSSSSETGNLGPSTGPLGLRVHRKPLHARKHTEASSGVLGTASLCARLWLQQKGAADTLGSLTLAIAACPSWRFPIAATPVSSWRNHWVLPADALCLRCHAQGAAGSHCPGLCRSGSCRTSSLVQTTACPWPCSGACPMPVGLPRASRYHQDALCGLCCRRTHTGPAAREGQREPIPAPSLPVSLCLGVPPGWQIHPRILHLLGRIRSPGYSRPQGVDGAASCHGAPHRAQLWGWGLGREETQPHNQRGTWQPLVPRKAHPWGIPPPPHTPRTM